MTRIINPKLESFEISSEWKKSGNSSWWAKDIDVYLKDISTEGQLNEVKYGSSIGEVFSLCVCSSDYLKSPGGEFQDTELEKALVLDNYDESKVEVYLRENIDSIGEITRENFATRISRFLYSSEI